MSGNYIQRGEPAIVNKWARAKMALQCGVDLIIELPVPYAMSSAEFFAYGAVKILNDIGVVDYLCFGSETADINTFDIIADILVNEPASYKNMLKQELDKGKSFPSARETALKNFLSEKGTNISDFEAVIGSSNNILGIEYIKALKRLKSKITPVTIKRINNSYNSEELTGSISSATSIRKLIQSKNGQLDMVLPSNCLNILEEEFNAGRGPIYPNTYELLIISSIRRMTKEDIRMLPYVSEGMENRIKDAAETSGTWDELIEKISTKRYTRTRVQRILTSIMAGITSVDFDNFHKFGGPQYARVLGLNNKGRQLLSYMNKTSRIPIITKSANFTNSCNPLLRKMLKMEAFATDMYVLGYQNPLYRKAGQEFTQNVIVIK